MFVSQAGTTVLALASALILPRYLGADAIGKLNLSASLWGIAGVGIAFGLDVHLVKASARHPERSAEMLVDTLNLRVGLFVVALVAMLGYVQLVDYASETVLVIFIMSVSILGNQCVAALSSTLQGLESMRTVAIANVTAKAISAVFAIGLALAGYGVVFIVSTYTITSAVNLALMYIGVNKLQPLRYRLNVPASVALLGAGLPYVVSSAFLVAYQQLDVVVISWLVDERAVGYYSVSSQLFGTLLFVPNILMAATLPTMSRMQTNARDELDVLMRRSFDLLMVFSIPIGLGLAVVASPLIRLVYGPTFAASGLILTVMGIVLIFTYLNMLVSQFLIATDRQTAWSIVLGVSACATLALDLVLVPWCAEHLNNGAVGGALSFLVTEIFMLAIAMRLMPPGTLTSRNGMTTLKAIAAGAVMVGAIWPFRDRHVVIPIVIGMIVYPVAVWQLRVLSPDEMGVLRTLGARAMDRVRKRPS